MSLGRLSFSLSLPVVGADVPSSFLELPYRFVRRFVVGLCGALFPFLRRTSQFPSLYNRYGRSLVGKLHNLAPFSASCFSLYLRDSGSCVWTLLRVELSLPLGRRNRFGVGLCWGLVVLFSVWPKW